MAFADSLLIGEILGVLWWQHHLWVLQPRQHLNPLHGHAGGNISSFEHFSFSYNIWCLMSVLHQTTYDNQDVTQTYEAFLSEYFRVTISHSFPRIIDSIISRRIFGLNAGVERESSVTMEVFRMNSKSASLTRFPSLRFADDVRGPFSDLLQPNICGLPHAHIRLLPLSPQRWWTLIIEFASFF